MDSASRRDALARLYQRHYQELVRLGFGLTTDRGLAEELAQEAFVRAWRSWWTIRDERSAPAYLRATVVNLAHTSLRRRLRERHALRDPCESRDRDVEAGLDLLRALARLPPRKRACIILRYYVDLSEQDTALALGVQVGTVKSQTAKGLRMLQEMLADRPAAVRRPEPYQGGA